jgi:hypothetical protein
LPQAHGAPPSNLAVLRSTGTSAPTGCCSCGLARSDASPDIQGRTPSNPRTHLHWFSVARHGTELGGPHVQGIGTLPPGMCIRGSVQCNCRVGLTRARPRRKPTASTSANGSTVSVSRRGIGSARCDRLFGANIPPITVGPTPLPTRACLQRLAAWGGRHGLEFG